MLIELTEQEKQLKTKLIEKILLMSLEKLYEEKLSSDLLKAIHDVKQNLKMNFLLRNNEIDKEDEVKTLKFLEEYVKQIS